MCHHMSSVHTHIAYVRELQRTHKPALLLILFLVSSSTRLWLAVQDTQADIVGTVMVRDVVERSLIAHFRAHNSPLLALQFDPSGTLLVTASLHGHNVHIFQICPRQGPDRPISARPTASAIHLFRLSRGVTPAVIEDISFSQTGAWLAVSSARGTTHLFRWGVAAQQLFCLQSFCIGSSSIGSSI